MALKKKYSIQKKNLSSLKNKKEKEDAINEVLIELRRNNLRFTENNRALQAKMNHFTKMFHSLKENEKAPFIEFFLKIDNWPLNK